MMVGTFYGLGWLWGLICQWKDSHWTGQSGRIDLASRANRAVLGVSLTMKGTQQMTPITPVNTEIQDYLRGVARARSLNDLNSLCDSDWAALAKTELRRREEEAAQRLLMLFSPQALATMSMTPSTW